MVLHRPVELAGLLGTWLRRPRFFLRLASQMYTLATPGCGTLMAIPSGTKLGSYEVVAQIGAGGMGEVYQADDTKGATWRSKFARSVRAKCWRCPTSPTSARPTVLVVSIV